MEDLTRICDNLRREMQRRTWRLKLVDMYESEYCNPTEGVQYPTAVTGRGCLVVGTLSEDADGQFGGTILVAQSALWRPTSLMRPEREWLSALRRLATDDYTRGLVRRIGDI